MVVKNGTSNEVPFSYHLVLERPVLPPYFGEVYLVLTTLFFKDPIFYYI